MYGLSDVLKGLKNPDLAALELWRLYNRKLRGRTGIAVMEEDWDNLVILDACRYDVFEEMHDFDGELQPVISQGGTTKEFLQANFASRDFPDTVYVSPNSNLVYLDSKFHDRVRLFVHAQEPLWPDEFDVPVEIVFPETTADWGLETHARNPNKRLIVHFNQPHAPFLGEKGKEIRAAEVDGESYSTWYETLREDDTDITTEDAWEAYRETLELTLPHVERLVEGLRGKTVITADHGELFGDNPFGLLGHPGGDVFLTDLVTVPWHVIEGETRKEIVDGDATEGPIEMTEEIRRSLRNLGYVPEE